MKLSVLDQSTAAEGRDEAEAIRDTIALARHCEALGYARFWVSEHHNSGSIVGTAPEVLMAAIAATTRTIRVGSAGVMLPHYAALKVAEQFRVLEAIAPGRIDLGVGRAPGSDRLTAYALNPAGGDADQFPQQIVELQAWLADAPLPERHPFAAITAHPRGPTQPEIWVLGSSDYGARLAAHFGLPYAFAYFFSDGRGVEEALDLYRRHYRPSARHPTPQATICIWALAADTEAEARRLLRTREYWRDRLRAGHPPCRSSRRRSRPRIPTRRPSRRASTRCASARSSAPATQVAARLQAEAARLGLDELVVVTWTFDPAARLRSYELIAKACGLRARRRHDRAAFDARQSARRRAADLVDRGQRGSRRALPALRLALDPGCDAAVAHACPRARVHARHDVPAAAAAGRRLAARACCRSASVPPRSRASCIGTDPARASWWPRSSRASSRRRASTSACPTILRALPIEIADGAALCRGRPAARSTGSWSTASTSAASPARSIRARSTAAAARALRRTACSSPTCCVAAAAARPASRASARRSTDACWCCRCVRAATPSPSRPPARIDRSSARRCAPRPRRCAAIPASTCCAPSGAWPRRRPPTSPLTPVGQRFTLS